MGARIFVYGSLLRGEENHGALGGARFVGSARTAARFTLVSLGRYPGLLDGGATAVAGELYEVTDDLLGELDDFEGHPEHYMRTSIDIEEGGQADAYVLPAHRGRDFPVVISGDWRLRMTGGFGRVGG